MSDRPATPSYDYDPSTRFHDIVTAVNEDAELSSILEQLLDDPPIGDFNLDFTNSDGRRRSTNKAETDHSSKERPSDTSASVREPSHEHRRSDIGGQDTNESVESDIGGDKNLEGGSTPANREYGTRKRKQEERNLDERNVSKRDVTLAAGITRKHQPIPIYAGHPFTISDSRRVYDDGPTTITRSIIGTYPPPTHSPTYNPSHSATHSSNYHQGHTSTATSTTSGGNINNPGQTTNTSQNRESIIYTIRKSDMGRSNRNEPIIPLAYDRSTGKISRIEIGAKIYPVPPMTTTAGSGGSNTQAKTTENKAKEAGGDDYKGTGSSPRTNRTRKWTDSNTDVGVHMPNEKAMFTRRANSVHIQALEPGQTMSGSVRVTRGPKGRAEINHEESGAKLNVGFSDFRRNSTVAGYIWDVADNTTSTFQQMLREAQAIKDHGSGLQFPRIATQGGGDHKVHLASPAGFLNIPLFAVPIGTDDQGRARTIYTDITGRVIKRHKDTNIVTVNYSAPPIAEPTASVLEVIDPEKKGVTVYNLKTNDEVMNIIKMNA